MKNDRTVTDLAEDGADLYPHLKITAENFPRILATRRIEDDGAEYFGAFLTKTSVRILIDFINRTFRLRSCDIPIDGSFPMPCTQYYHKRCVAPCVSNLCSTETYALMVSLARMFLSNRRGDFRSALKQQMSLSSEELDFERAAYWRDMLTSVEEYWSNSRLDVWLDDAVDTYDEDETVAGSFIYLVTQRGRNVLGRKVFRLPPGGGLPPHEALERIISSFYRFHLPREIRVSLDFEGRKQLVDELSQKFGREVKIVLTSQDKQRITAVRGLQSAWFENELDLMKGPATARQISGELKRSFGLGQLPSRVEAFDVAHISNLYFVAASTVWENGAFLPEEHMFHVSAEKSEPAAMGDSVRKRLTGDVIPKPDLILLDGGRAQLNAVMTALGEFGLGQSPVIGAVKPQGKHSSVSHFILTTGEQIEYEPDNPAHNMLRLLRDGAHDLANRVHRDLRDMGHHYELAALLPSLTESERRHLVASVGSLRKIREIDADDLAKLVEPDLASRVMTDLHQHRTEVTEAVIPLVVPIRFDAENGNAEDLIPINSK
jgi:excinuclease ABC subunit C